MVSHLPQEGSRSFWSFGGWFPCGLEVWGGFPFTPYKSGVQIPKTDPFAGKQVFPTKMVEVKERNPKINLEGRGIHSQLPSLGQTWLVDRNPIMSKQFQAGRHAV